MSGSVWNSRILVLLLPVVLTLSPCRAVPLYNTPAKRQWLFHCGGWGPGCMKTAMDVKSRFLPSPLPYSGALSQVIKQAEGRFEPAFILTSGSSWGAIGKRGHLPYQKESFRQILLHVLLSKTGYMYKEMLYKGMLRRYMQQRMRNQMNGDRPQLS